MAFLQWRYEYPSKLNHDERQLEELILTRINMFTSNMVKADQAEISEETKKHSVIANDFLTKEKYDLI